MNGGLTAIGERAVRLLGHRAVHREVVLAHRDGVVDPGDAGMGHVDLRGHVRVDLHPAGVVGHAAILPGFLRCHGHRL
jgi:hypothetical protein